VTFPPLPQLKLALNLATKEGCKAELTWLVVISQDSLPAEDGHPVGLCDSAVERQSLASVLSPSCARPVADQ